jgi:asparagine synthase (glutamine-hydrolysing)
VSAIVGLYYTDGQAVAPVDLGRMVESLAHRGPDAAGAWTDGPVGLGHRMLWTTPESFHEQLPMVNKRGDVVIIADARIDNRDELISALGVIEPPPGAITDSGLILSAYERWGESSPKKLLGDFAFAIWDHRRQTLFCARDHFGVKPFYYHRSGRVFAFGSEIKALLTLREVPRQLNQVRVADHLAGIFDDQAITFYRDVFRLPAGHSMTVRRAEASVQPYCWLDPFREVRLPSDDDYADAFRERFTEAVRCRLRSAFRVGGLLSGGLDSSAIVGTARRLLEAQDARPLHTFSAIFPGLPEADLRKIDERPFVDAVLAMGGFASHYVRADCLSPLTDLDRVFWHEDEAFLAPNLYMHWALYSAAHQQDVRVLLDGIDGDTTVSHGLDYLSELARAVKVRKLGREVLALSRRHNSSARTILWQFGLRPLVPEPLRHVWRAARRSTQPSWRVNTVIKPVFARRVDLTGRAQALRKKGHTSTRTAREGHWRGLTSALFPYALELADKAAAAFSLEPRYPFFDRRLVEFCLALPPEQKLHQGWTRVIMRRAMVNILPDEVRWRIGKANLSPNFKRRLLEYDRALLEDVIMNDPQVIEDYVDVSALRDAYRRYNAQPMSEGDALTVYGAVNLALWLRRTGLTP